MVFKVLYKLSCIGLVKDGDLVHNNIRGINIRLVNPEKNLYYLCVPVEQITLKWSYKKKYFILSDQKKQFYYFSKRSFEKGKNRPFSAVFFLHSKWMVKYDGIVIGFSMKLQKWDRANKFIFV